jgi:hypothetical protein
VGFGFGKPLMEELAGEGGAWAFTTASSCLFLPSSAAFFFMLFLQEENAAKAEKNDRKNSILNHKNQRKQFLDSFVKELL